MKTSLAIPILLMLVYGAISAERGDVALAMFTGLIVVALSILTLK